MEKNDRCLFCRIANNELSARKVYEDSDMVAFEDINPQAPTHVLVIPRKHVASLDVVTEADAPLIGLVLARTAKLAQDLHLGDGYRVVVNTGDNAGQTVFHLHFHLIGGRSMGWPPG